jgi:hypothetical protein
MDRAFAELRDTLAGHRGLKGAKGRKAVERVQLILEKRMSAMRPLIRAFEPSVLEHMGTLMKVGTEQNLRYEMISIGDKEISVQGLAPLLQNCDALVAAFAETGIDLDFTRGEEKDDGKIRFSAVSETVGE